MVEIQEHKNGFINSGEHNHRNHHHQNGHIHNHDEKTNNFEAELSQIQDKMTVKNIFCKFKNATFIKSFFF